MGDFTMKVFKVSLSFLFIIVLTIAIFAFTAEQTEGQKGLVTFVEGAAKKQKLEETKWLNVFKDTEVIGGERVRTFSQSRAELELAQLDKIRMAPKTTIDILKLYQETKDNVQESKIVLQKGDLWANVAKKPGNMKFSIGTPVAAAAITGTTLRVNVGADSSAELKVYNGEVILTNAPESQTVVPKSIQPYEIEGPHEIAGPHEVSMEEWSLIVKSMQKVRVDKDGNVLYSGQFSKKDDDEKTSWVKWNQQRDKESGIH